MQFKLFLPSLRAGIQACSLILCTSQASQALAEPSINCKQWEYLAFSLQKAPFPLDRSKAQVVADFPWSFSDPMNTNNIRLDVCFDGTTQRAELQRVLWLNYAFATPNYAEGAGIIKVEGLAEALFGDYSNFEIKVIDEFDSGLFVKGWGIGDQAFITAVPVVFQGSGYQLTSIAFPAGVLVNADPFTGGPCPAGQSFRQSSFQLGTASFQAETCMFLGGGQTMGYDIIKLSVQDSSPALSLEYRSQVQVLSSDQLKSALNYKWNHHNACD